MDEEDHITQNDYNFFFQIISISNAIKSSIIQHLWFLFFVTLNVFLQVLQVKEDEK